MKVYQAISDLEIFARLFGLQICCLRYCLLLFRAFELINESGKLLKQLEKQSKEQFEKMEMKHNTLDSKVLI